MEKGIERIKEEVDVNHLRNLAKENDMFKAFAIGFLVCGIGLGFLWWTVGRNDIGEIRANYDRSSADLERIQRNISELSDNSDGFARDITTINSTSKRIGVRSGRLEEGLLAIDGDFGLVITKVDELEKFNRRALVLNRDYGDFLFDLRQLNKESGIKK